LGKAHDRNLVRRRIREALHACAPDIPGIIVSARSSSRTATFWDLLHELEALVAEPRTGVVGDTAD
jgi:ribonuclease P protein component